MTRKIELELKNHMSKLNLCEPLSESEKQELVAIYAEEIIDDIP